jgi:HK97 family phage major capsid protein
MNIEQLRERLAVLNGEAQSIRETAEKETRDLTVEESNQLDAILNSFEKTKTDIDRLSRLEEQTDLLNTGQGRKTQPDQPTNLEGDEADDVQVTRPQPREQKLAAVPHYKTPSNWNYQSLGEFAQDVKRASVKGGQFSRKLELSEKLAAATVYGNEGSGSDGGFAVPPDFRTAIMTTIMGEASLLTRCDQITVNGNNFTCPVDETTPWQTSGGILATWDGEAQAANQSKPALGERTVKLNKLRALVPLTEEILEDASALDAYLRKKAPDKINFKLNLALVQGTGVGQPLGILNSPALITVTKESGQQANTIVGNNIFKMYNRMYGPLRSDAVWIYNQEVEPQLFKLSVPGTDNTGNAVTGWGGLVYMPPGGISSAPYGSLMGRPCIPTQACPALSSAGDIMFVNFQAYLAILKSGPNPRVDISMHLWFDQDLTAFKFTLRVGGMSWWSAAASPLAGSNSYSPFVALGAR